MRAPPEMSGKTDDTLENLLLLLRVELDVGAGEKGPARRYPEGDLAPRAGGLLLHKLTQGLEGDLEAFSRAIEAGGTGMSRKPSARWRL
jgi:hypothetical protein